jgi:hypothetical protein
LSQVYNADETGFFWKPLPQNTQANKKDSSVCGRKLNNEHLTTLVCANADKSHRLKPVITGETAKPRRLRHIMRDMPVIYMANKKALATKDLFFDWFRNHFAP